MTRTVHTMRIAVLLLLSACSVRESYVVATETMQQIASRTPEEREHLAVPAQRAKDGRSADVRASTFVAESAKSRGDGTVVVLSKLRTKRLVLANALVWTATPFSIAGTLMIILGRGAARWSGIAIAGAAEPALDVGTAFWVRGALAHPQELPRGLADVTYLPTPGQPR